MDKQLIDGKAETLGPFFTQEERFFLETQKDLQHRLSAGDEYNSIRAAGLLRQLLIDTVPLIVAANRETKIKVRFGIPVQPAHSGEKPFFSWMPLHLSEKMEEVTREGLLRRVVLTFHQYEFTVRDVIKAVANLHGGVHLDKPKSEIEKAITAANSFFRTPHSGAVVSAVKGIGDIFLEGTRDLVEAIQNRTLFTLEPIPGEDGHFKILDVNGNPAHLP